MFRRAIVFVALSSVALASCSRALFVQPSGSIDTGIRFDFFRDPDRSTKDEYRVTYALLAQIDHDGNETERWRLIGESKLYGIDYGDVPQGLTEESPAQPLVADRVYLIEIHEKPFAIGTTLFRFSDTGQVEECRTVQECHSGNE